MGDFNHDGIPDIVTIGPYSQIAILISQPGDRYGPATVFSGADIQQQLFNVVTGDFNGDGNLDFAVAVWTGISLAVRIYRGDGHGGFNDPIETISGPETTHRVEGFVAGDFNSDGKLDLAWSEELLGVVEFLGDGAGHFDRVVVSAPIYVLFDPGQSMAVADLNHDGSLDLVVTNGATVHLYFGDGRGRFREDSSLKVPDPWGTPNGPGVSPGPVHVADFDGDGHLDIAVGDENFQTVSIFYGDGTGRFRQPHSPAVFEGVHGGLFHFGVADIDGDGSPDIVTAADWGIPDTSGFGVMSLRIHFNLGGGTFSNTDPHFAPGPLVADFLLTDADGDGVVDLVVGNYLSGQVMVVPGDGEGGFVAGNKVLPTLSGAVTSTDIDGDGRLDLILDDGWIGYGNGDGSFRPGPRVYAGRVGTAVAGRIGSAAVADLNHDGIADIIFSDGSVGGLPDVLVALGQPGGSFLSPQMIASGSSTINEQVLAVHVADLDKDGNLDLVYTNRYGQTLGVIRGRGDGTFFPAATYSVGAGLGADFRPGYLALADFTGDGFLDIVVSDTGYGLISVLLGKGDGTFGAPDVISPLTGAGGSFGVGQVVADDFNGDSKMDIAVPIVNGYCAMIFGRGDGTFDPPRGFFAGFVADRIIEADMNGDGAKDLIVGGSEIRVLLNDGTGNFDLGTSTYPGACRLIAVADFDGDGKADEFLNCDDLDTESLDSSLTYSVLVRNSTCTPRRLSVLQSPTGCLATGQTFPSPPVVGIFDDAGNLVAGASGEVTSQVRGSGDATLLGSTQASLLAGIATFSGEGIQGGGPQEQIFFESGSAKPVISPPFSTIVPVEISGPQNACGICAPIFKGPPRYDSYAWSIDGGATISTQPEIRMPPLRSGPHTMRLDVGSGGCSASATLRLKVSTEVTVMSGPPLAPRVPGR